MSCASTTRQFGFALIGRGMAVAALAAVVVSSGWASPCRAEGMPPEVFEQTKHAAVMVITSSSKNKEGDTPFGSGSGFFVNRTGMAITNNHVVDPGHQKSPQEKFALKNQMNRLVWTVVTDGGTEEEKEWKADVLYQNERADIAVLQTRDKDGEYLETPNFLEFFPSTWVDEGMRAWCFGFPGGDRRKGNVGDHARVARTWGNITEMQRTPSGRLKMIQTDVLANQGNSGGPFVNDKGQLIGVLTLGSQSEAQANTTMLVPGDLVHEMIQTSFRRGKVQAGVDLRPFYKLFLTEERAWDFPMFEREANRDCISVEGGARMCGAVAGETITLPTPLGEIEIPTSAMAYIVAEEDRMIAFVEGGDMLPFDPDETTLMFKPPGGKPREVPLGDVTHIGFRQSTGDVRIPSGESHVLMGSGMRLSLQDVTGKVAFEDEVFGEVQIPVSDVRNISGDFDRVLATAGGSRMTGSFASHELGGKLSWCDRRGITFSFGDFDEGDCDIRLVDYSENMRVREITLTETIQTSDERLLRIARALDKGDMDAAESLTRPLIAGDMYRSLTEEKQQQLRFLDGELMFRSGKLKESYSVFRKLDKDNTKTANIRWSAKARMALMDRFEDGMVDGQPLSQPATYEGAGQQLAEVFVREAKLTIETLETTQVGKRSEYNKLLKRAEDAEDKLLVSSRLTAGQPEQYLVRLWRVVANLHRNELGRMQADRQKVEEELRQRGGRRNESRQRLLNQRLERLARDSEKATAGIQETQIKIREAGFIIDDPNKDKD